MKFDYYDSIQDLIFVRSELLLLLERVRYRMQGKVSDRGQLGGRQNEPCSLQYSS